MPKPIGFIVQRRLTVSREWEIVWPTARPNEGDCRMAYNQLLRGSVTMFKNREREGLVRTIPISAEVKNA